MRTTLLLFSILVLFLSCERENEGIGNVDDTTSHGGSSEIICDGLFSVSEILKVHFAPANLKSGGHGFVAHQYDRGGLFGWGTGNRPTIATIESEDYSLFYDWGGYNTGGLWRTLSSEEWQYILSQRENARIKCGMGTVLGVPGVVLLPDNWAQPDGCTFKSGYGWRRNVYDLDQWNKMEKAGAVFLPVAGYRWGMETYYEGEGGYYWTSTTSFPTSPDANYLCFSDSYLGLGGGPRAMGCSVRLVQDKR